MGNTYIKTREDMVREFTKGERGGKPPKKPVKGHFSLRLFLAALFFLVFFLTERYSLSFRGYTKEWILEAIRKNDSISCFSELPVLYYEK
jgi:hypothetical protein